MKIGELARKSGVSRDTIRYYERRGLLPKAARPAASNQYKAYDQAAVLRLRLIRYAQGLGFTLAELQDMLEPWAQGRATPEAKRRALSAKLREIETRQRELEEIRQALVAQIRQLRDA